MNPLPPHKEKKTHWPEEGIKIKGQLSGRNKGRVSSYFILSMNQACIVFILILFWMSEVQ